VFAAPLHSNERGADHRKHHSSIVARGNVFTEPLPINEIFRLSGIMSQYVIHTTERVSSSGNTFDLCLGGVEFQSHRHAEYRGCYFMVFLGHSR
jgi:hypothetical protein